MQQPARHAWPTWHCEEHAANPPEDAPGAGLTQNSELDYCGTSITHSGGVTVTGTANYQYRPTVYTNVYPTPNGLYGNPVSAGIPFAEIAVYDSAGTLVQCSTTSASGAISLTVPSGAGSYTLYVRSRSDSAKLKVSVLEDYYANQPYSISTSFNVLVSDTTKAVGTITASARQSTSAKIEGGAFNILAQVYKVNEYFRAKLSDPSFVAPKVRAYWKAGFNPYDYFYDGGSSGISFYAVGTGNLFILGGIAGDVKDADTDHFDNSVVIHEYGHFLEDVYSVSDSPGGSHGPKGYVDPRLGWSEAWANFLQGAVLNDGTPTWKHYIDTYGFGGDSVETNNVNDSGINIFVDLSMSGDQGRCYSTASVDSCGAATVAGEGTFKEMSISRFLFKTVRAVADGGAEIPFAALWEAFTAEDSSGTPVGLKSSQLSFRNIALFNQYLRAIIVADHGTLLAGWDSIRDNEKQSSDRRDYAEVLSLTSDNGCAQKSMAPVADQSNPNQRSNPLRSNDFFEFDHDGNPKQIRLVYTGGIDNGSTYLDLDVFLYKDGYSYIETATANDGSIVRSSSRAPALDTGTETIDLAGLPAGRYLINVKAYTYAKLSSQLTGTLNYRLKQIDSLTRDLCPAH